MTPQSEPPVVPLAPIVAPSSSAPALVSWDESFTVTVLMPPGVDAGRAEEWVVALTTRTKVQTGEWIGQPVDLRYVLSVEQVRSATTPGLALLTVRLGARPPRDTYHLSVAGGCRARGSTPCGCWDKPGSLRGSASWSSATASCGIPPPGFPGAI